MGVSDASFTLDSDPFHAMKDGLRRHTYHTLDITDMLDKARNGTSIRLVPLPSCQTFDTCWECTTHGTAFNCHWCPALGLCSDEGNDRRRMTWLQRCYAGSSSGSPVKDYQKCGFLDVIHEKHEFYNKTTIVQPKVNYSVEVEGVANVRHFNWECNDEAPDFIPVTLPFEFPYFARFYSYLRVYPRGFVAVYDEDDATLLQHSNTINPLKNNTATKSIAVNLTFGFTDDEFAVRWIHPQITYELLLRADGIIGFKYHEVDPAFSDDSYFVGLAGVIPDNNDNHHESRRISTPSVHIRRGLIVKFDPNFPVDRNMTAEGIAVLTLGSITLLIITSLVVSLTLRHAKMHPASYPGQILVRLRMRGYTTFHVSDHRRDSIATTSSIVTH